MKKITFPLKPEMQSESVADLQDGLLFLLDKGVFQLSDAELQEFKASLRGERKKSFYGLVTLKLVGIFKERRRLEPSPFVDERTAKELNTILEKLGAFDPGDQGRQWIVQGQVKREDGKPYPEAVVKAFRVDFRGGSQLGETITNAEGQYVIKYKEPAMGSISLQVFVYDSKGKELCYSEVKNNPTPEETINLIVTDDGKPPAPYRIGGRIVSHELRGLPGLHVIALDINVGENILLGEGTTGDRGAYEVMYPAERLKEGKKRPDIQVHVLDANGAVLFTSAVHYNASPEVRNLDVVIPEEKLPRQAEYNRLINVLGSQLGTQDETLIKQRLAALKEDDQQQDVTYLANKTGWDARMVAMTSLASQFSEKSGVEPEFYYALFRTGVPANEAVLTRISPDIIQQAWEQAVESEILPPELKEKIDENLERFKAFSATNLLQAPAQIGVSSFQELLKGAMPDNADQQRFAQLYYDQRSELQTFWKLAASEFPEAANRLQLDSKLGFLTVNNAPLIQRLHELNEDMTTPLDLVRRGFYQEEIWEQTLGANVAIPAEIPGETQVEKRTNYAAFMANQLRLSYPTAVVSEMVKTAAIPLHADQQINTAVAQFLDDNQGKFELGIHPVEYYLNQNNIVLEDPVLNEVKKLQRVFQISPSDEVMGKLLNHNIDSAYALVRYDEQSFINTFKDELGGETIARLTYAKAHQVHHAVLNITTAYLLEKSAFPLFAIDNLPVLKGNENPILSLTDEDTGVLAYPTLEGIFGEMEYCTCEHCRSWLSPAAYLVDLLQFLDPPTYEKENPLGVLLSRRPDIQHLQLTCENTNTVLPYIDLVNEVLEHYVVNGSLAAFKGHNIETGMTTEELLANPQFVNDTAYTNLRNEVFPSPLPFHQPLEMLRRYFQHFDIPLSLAMKRLRTDDNLDRHDGIGDPAYGWRDILMEGLHLSRQEHALLTDSSTSLQILYGENPGTVTEAQLIDEFSKAKKFARRLNLTYEELIDITRTQFINPHSDLIFKLEKLHLNFATIQAFIDGTLTEAAFEALLPEDLDPAPFGGDVNQWVIDNQTPIMNLIVLSSPAEYEDVCSFDTVELRYALPDFDNNKLKPVEFLKLLRFIRLWRKLNWSIEQVDKTITALYPKSQYPDPGDDPNTANTRLDEGFKIFILRLAHLDIVMKLLDLTLKRDLTALLACWSMIDIHGYHSLYRQMFLNPTILALDDVFQEDGYGGYLDKKKEFQTPGAELPKLLYHTEALRAAFNLTQGEFSLIQQALKFDENSILNLENVSNIFRHGYLARKLRLSVRELLALKSLSGLDPFLQMDLIQPPDPDEPFGTVIPTAIRFIELAQQIKDSPFKISQLVYFIQHEDWSGKASPTQENMLAIGRTLRNDVLRIDHENSVQEDPTGEISRTKMTLVYGSQVSDVFFGLLNNTSSFRVTYDHGQPALENDILAVTDRIAYDDFMKQLSFRGVMTPAEKAALDTAVSATNNFRTGVQTLFDAGQEMFTAFFTRFPDLKGLYENFMDSSDPLSDRMSALLNDFLPDLRAKLKRQQVGQTVSAQVGADFILVSLLLENASLLHAVGVSANPAINDFLALGTQGLSADIFYSNDVVGDADQPNILVPTINYQEGEASLPLDPADENSPVSGIWRGLLEVVDNGFHNFYLEADAGAEVDLMLDGQPLTLILDNGIWHNQDAIELQAGHLYDLQFTAKKVKNRLVLKWERKGMGRSPIPVAQLYPAEYINRFTTTYLRMLKALEIAETSGLTYAELEHFASYKDYFINGERWLNALSGTSLSDEPTIQAIFWNLIALLRFFALKEALKIGDERLLEVLKDPTAAGEDGVSFLERVTGWQGTVLTAILEQFGLDHEDLVHLDNFIRMHQIFEMVKKVGIGAAALRINVTNEPTGEMVRVLQAALRTLYDHNVWLQVIQPINDELRNLQRDALVASVLHTLQQKGETDHIDTVNKLFEYFLIDVEMDPCMKTSRIRQALSSVQMFIQRCLLNLEPQVASSSINAKQWEWMKRYRVWEANRKIFLFPENWLEPELRDNKSPFFKDLESELLQSDITDDAAATALVHYLEKLDDVAKLEICSMYYEEKGLQNEADDIIHVIARTSGARRIYYYRRQEGGVDWTPWEKMDLNIEDNPVLLVVWKGRLFVFWISIMQKAVQPPSDDKTKLNLTDVTPSQLKGVSGEAKIKMTATLYWSEYYNGKWQPARSSDPNKPILIGDDFNTSDGIFDRTIVTLRSSEGSSGELFVYLSYPGKTENYYKLYNTHSQPVRKEEVIDEPLWFIHFPQRSRSFSTQTPFTVSYTDPAGPIISKWTFPLPVLNRGVLYEIIEPRHQVSRIFEAPFFFQDRQHVFFVQSKESKVLVGGYLDFGLWLPPQVVMVEPPILIKPDFPWPPEEFVLTPDLINPGFVDPGPVEAFIKSNPNINQAMGTVGTIRYGSRLIGPSGSIPFTNQSGVL